MTDTNDLIEQYPRLGGLNVDLSDVTDAAEKAADTGEEVEVAHSVDMRCSDPKRECNLDHLYYYVTPEGEITVERVHTY